MKVLGIFTRAVSGLIGLFLAMPVLAQASLPIVLVRSDATQDYYAANKGNYAKILEPWRSYFSRSSVSYRELSIAQLRQLQQPAIMILPSAVVLSAEDNEVIEQKLAQGSSMLGTWAMGVRDVKGQWLGYGRLERWFNNKVLSEVRAESEDRFLLPFGETPLTFTIPAGKRIYLGKISEPMLRVQAAPANVAGRYSVWARESYPAERRLAAISFDEVDASRRVYFGFPETAWQTAGPVFDEFLKNALTWLGRVPQVAKAAWPDPAQSAFFFEMDTEDKYDNALVLAQHLESRQLRSTFYSVTDIAAKSRATVLKLAQKHELALHGDLHTGFKGQTGAAQQERFTRQFAQMKEILGGVDVIRGFRAPLEDFDGITEQVMRASGIRHHVSGVNASEDLLPYFAKENGAELPSEQALLVIPRGLLDDINYVRMGITDPVHVAEVMQGALADVVQSRGLGLFSVHSQNFFPGGVLDRHVPALLDTVVNSKGLIWFPTGTQIEQWWRARERVQIQARSGAQDRLEVALRVLKPLAGEAAVRNLRLVLASPRAGLKPVLSGDPKLLALTRTVELDRHRFGLNFDSLAPGEYRLQVNFR